MLPIIFYVDDQPTNLTVFQAAMPDEWSVHVFEDPLHAEQAMDQEKPWIVVSDQRMPQLSGVDLLEKTKQQLPDTLRIITTGYSEEDLVIEAVRRAQIFDYIRKPWDAEELVLILERAIKHYQMERDLKAAQQAAENALIKQYAAEEVARKKNEFLANMSHELKTPLNAILGFTEMVLERVRDDKEASRDLQIVKNAANHLDDMICNILDIANDETDRVIIKKTPSNIHQLLNKACEVCLPQALKNNNKLNTTITTGDYVMLDPIRVKQVLINLINNACKFTHNGTIEIVVKENDEAQGISIIVSDNGIGIEKAHHDRIFEPFTQLDMSSTKPFDGVGLGLNISQRLARKMGGDILVESEYGVGSTFTLWLPDVDHESLTL